MPTGIYKHPPQCGFQKGHKINIGRRFSKKRNKKISIARKGIIFSKKHIKNLSLSHKGKCIGKDNPHWKGRITCGKYILIYYPSHPFCNKGKYVSEHRLIIEKIIGRYLLPKEVVHHINENKHDNRPQNLMVFSPEGYHHAFHLWDYDNPKYIVFDGRKL